MHKKHFHFIQRTGRAEIVALFIMVMVVAVSGFITDVAIVSVMTHFMIALMGALSVYIMLRMNLMFFAVPAFMAVGGYAAAILSTRYEVTDLFVLTVTAFGLPFFLALPIGKLVLRMRGVYFVLVTFVIAEITPLVLFETPKLTGGSNGIANLPAVTTLGNRVIETNQAVLLLATCLALLALVLTVIITRHFKPQFDSIRENEILAESMGLSVPRYKIIGFCFASGIAGMAGFTLVEMLITAHPSSFSALSSVNYVAYTIVGGQHIVLGPIVGAAVLVWAANIFSLQGEISQGLFGLLLMIAVVFAKNGLVGLVSKRKVKHD